MTTQEFSNEFDVLYNNIMSNAAPGLDEYEKSVFLTTALEEIITNLYSGKNTFNDSFEKTEEVRRYLSNLVHTYETDTKVTTYKGISNKSVFFILPDDLWFITYETVSFNDSTLGLLNGSYALVVPILLDEYSRIEGNPFKGPNEKRVLRLDTDNSVVELISSYNISKYIIRYLSKPSPIILSDLDTGLSINGENKQLECKLNPAIHRTILKRAVNLAIESYKK